MNFEFLKLKKLIAVAYADSPIVKTRMCSTGHGYVAEMTFAADVNGDTAFDWNDIMEMFHNGSIKITDLNGKGDFRDEECLKLLNEADIVVTNPPFSLFREYVATLVEHEKKFLIIGNKNAVTYKEIFPLLKNNEMWLGYNQPAPKLFMTPSMNSDRNNVEDDGKGHFMASFGNIGWFTNLDISKRHEDIILFKRYREDPSFYPKYDNYDAINVDKVKYIPEDYDGVMGVPITFLDNYNPEQFEVLGMTKTPICHDNADCAKRCKTYSNAMQYKNGVYCGSGNKVNDGSVILSNNFVKDKAYYMTENVNGYLLAQYPIVLIRNLHPLTPKSSN